MNSSRFPEKVLWRYRDLPMILHVYRRACLAIGRQHTYITSDSIEILALGESDGANIIPTSHLNKNGSSRSSEASVNLNYDKIIILQADEILIDPSHLIRLIEITQTENSYKAWNIITNIDNELDLDNSNIVKCTLNRSNEIITIFRSTKQNGTGVFKKIMGTIAIEKNTLKELNNLPDSPGQISASIEQLKIVEYGLKLKGVWVDKSYPSINSIEDTYKVKRYVNSDLRQQRILDQYV